MTVDHAIVIVWGVGWGVCVCVGGGGLFWFTCITRKHAWPFSEYLHGVALCSSCLALTLSTSRVSLRLHFKDHMTDRNNVHIPSVLHITVFVEDWGTGQSCNVYCFDFHLKCD